MAKGDENKPRPQLASPYGTAPMQQFASAQPMMRQDGSKDFSNWNPIAVGPNPNPLMTDNTYGAPSAFTPQEQPGQGPKLSGIGQAALGHKQNENPNAAFNRPQFPGMGGGNEQQNFVSPQMMQQPQMGGQQQLPPELMSLLMQPMGQMQGMMGQGNNQMAQMQPQMAPQAMQQMQQAAMGAPSFIGNMNNDIAAMGQMAQMGQMRPQVGAVRQELLPDSSALPSSSAPQQPQQQQRTNLFDRARMRQG